MLGVAAAPQEAKAMEKMTIDIPNLSTFERIDQRKELLNRAQAELAKQLTSADAARACRCAPALAKLAACTSRCPPRVRCTLAVRATENSDAAAHTTIFDSVMQAYSQRRGDAQIDHRPWGSHLHCRAAGSCSTTRRRTTRSTRREA